MSEPFLDDDGKWYTWDETEVSALGPFESKAEALDALDKYIKKLDDVKSNIYPQIGQSDSIRGLSE